MGRTGVLSDRKKHGYPSQNALTRPEICLQILLYYFIKVLMFEDLS